MDAAAGGASAAPIDGYTIVYHASLMFRAAPIQLLLLDAGVPFQMQEPTWSPDRVVQGRALPMFAPPVIIQGDFALAQTPAILNYLGAAHGYGVDCADAKASATYLQTLLDIGDVTSELFDLAKDHQKKAAFAAPGGRLSNWLKHLGTVQAKLGGGAGGFLCTADRPTAADFFLLSAFDTFDFALGAGATAAVTPEGLRELRARLEARPSYAAFKAQATVGALFPSMKAPSKKLCIVMGIGPGIGLAVAKRMAAPDRGYHVAIVARRAAALEEYRAQIGGSTSSHPGDASSAADVKRVVAEILAAHGGPCELLVYNGGVWNETRAMTVSPEQFARDLDLCVTGALASAQQVHPGMKAAGRGTMLFTGGGLALFPEYGATVPSLTAGKSALRGLVLAMAADLQADGIRAGTVTVCGTVVPGSAFDPDLIAQRFDDMATGKITDVESKFDGK
jgi:NAD(P)-dependent dehydrogenase (short-subunit alcohol dehydrogenase family)/glutathione S-transferase